MALSLDAIHQPLNDFFLAHFATPDGSPVVFRFDTFGSVLSDADFVDPAAPDAGYSAALARERLSQLVNRVPVEASDGTSVVLTSDAVDSTWFDRLLSPAQAFLPPDADDPTRAALLGSFSAVKARGLELWDQLTLESSTGLQVQFRPASATPEHWYDRSQADLWTHVSFQVSGSGGGGSPSPAPPVLWRLRPDAEVLSRALEVVRPVSVVPLQQGVLQAVRSDVVSPLRLSVRDRHALGDLVQVRRKDIDVDPGGADVADRTDLPDRRLAALDMRDRLRLRQYVDDQTPTTTVATDTVTLSFDYCLVNVTREWLLGSLVNTPSWWVPGTPQGDVTTPGRPGAMACLPVGFVLVKDLHLQADWSDADRASAAAASSFGPFDIDVDAATGEIGKPGEQLVGWMLQALPPLPPHGSP